MFITSLSQLFIATFLARNELLGTQQGSSYGFDQLVSALFWLHRVAVHYNS